MSVFDDGSAANEPVSPTFHDFGVRVPPGADYVTESGQRVENRSDRVMEFTDDGTAAHEAAAQDDFETRANAALHGKMAATVHELVLVSETLRSLLGESLSRVTPQAEQIGRLMCRINQLEREAAARNHPSFADRAEAELVERAMPANALQHSR
jgi:hypothetical protein